MTRMIKTTQIIKEFQNAVFLLYFLHGFQLQELENQK